MRRWTTLADDQLARDTFAEKWERRRLHISSTLDGWVAGDFFLDPVAGETLINVLDHLAPPDPGDAPDEPRPLSQRRADALADLSNWYMNGDKPGGNPPNVDAVIDVASLAGDIPEMAAARCDFDGVGPVGRSVLDQMCCNAKFTRFIMSGPSQILDMGRSTRLATTAQRRAVVVRDRHSRFPSCNRRPQWCDIHHIAGGEATTLPVCPATPPAEVHHPAPLRKQDSNCALALHRRGCRHIAPLCARTRWTELPMAPGR
jgi:hypothetical protein